MRWFPRRALYPPQLRHACLVRGEVLDRWASSSRRTCHLFCHAQSRLRADRRTVFTSASPAAAIPPLVFCGLFASLWLYKCCMMIIFQNKIIYMPGIPPFAKDESIATYARKCAPVVWHEERIMTEDGKSIALCVSRIDAGTSSLKRPAHRSHVVIVYFQGYHVFPLFGGIRLFTDLDSNASSLPPRLPYLSSVLRRCANESSEDVRYTILAVSYRGYWKSKGRPSQKGIELDARAAIEWAIERYEEEQDGLRLVLWGQSIGAGVAATAASQYLTRCNVQRRDCEDRTDRGASLSSSADPKKGHKFSHGIHGLVLETPFTSLDALLVALYPQRWLPYRYLGPFLFNHWDSKVALKQMSEVLYTVAGGSVTLPKVLIIQAGKDELVPGEQGEELEELGKKLGFEVERKYVTGALHTEAMLRSDGLATAAGFLNGIGHLSRK